MPGTAAAFNADNNYCRDTYLHDLVTDSAHAALQIYSPWFFSTSFHSGLFHIAVERYLATVPA